MPKERRVIRSIQCSACGCGYMVGIDPDSERFAEDVARLGYGLLNEPKLGCPGCPCHTGEGLLPFLRIDRRTIVKEK